MLFSETVFGPIHSRRLGTSLGINLLPNHGKLCSFDCIYCECGYNADGRDDNRMPTRTEVYDALKSKLEKLKQDGVTPDVFTFAGNGEPTVNPEFHDIIFDTLKLRDIYFPDAKVSVLSNYTRIGNPDVFDALTYVDNNILKLDSVLKETVDRIDAPNSKDFDIDEIIANLAKFNGNVTLQTMFLRGEHNGHIVDNTVEKEVKGLIEAIKTIKPKDIMIYSIDRPTPEKALIKVDKDELEIIAERIRKETGVKVLVA